MATDNQKAALEEVVAEMAVPGISASAHDALLSLRSYEDEPIPGWPAHASEHRFCQNPKCGTEIVIVAASRLKDHTNWRCSCGSDMDNTDTRRQAVVDHAKHSQAEDHLLGTRGQIERFPH